MARRTRDDRSERRKRAYPTSLRLLEAQRLKQRRQCVNADVGEAAGIALDAPAVGFALSGGGVRSATFCLGLFQALASAGLLRRIDFLSTVSGGGYFGGFLGRLYSRPYARPSVVESLLRGDDGSHDVVLPADPSGSERQARVQPLKWLREHGRYMTPDGSGDVLSTLAVAIRNFVALHLVIGVMALLILLLLALPLVALDQLPGLAERLKPLPSLGLALFGGTLLTPSVWFDVVPLTIILLVVPPAWAYWLIEHRGEATRDPVIGLTVLVALAGAGALTGAAWSGRPSGPLLMEVSLVVLMAALLTIVAVRRARRASEQRIPGSSAVFTSPDINAEALYAFSTARADVTRRLAFGLELTALIAALAAFDTLGMSLYRASVSVSGIPLDWLTALSVAAGPLLLRLFGVGSRLARLGGGGNGLRLPAEALASLVGVAAWLALLIALSALVHGITYGFAVPSPEHPRQLLPTALGLLVTFVLARLIGANWNFVNRSSHASLYAARLTRAYLGASNPKRFAGGTPSGIQEPLLDDDDSIPGYMDGLAHGGGPMHFINVTINETASAEGRTVLRDRKGIGMAVGPFGISAGVHHHARYHGQGQARRDPATWAASLKPLLRRASDYSMFRSPGLPAHRPQAGRMSVGQWIGVSGAAFSTGLGSRSSLGLSLLLGFANVRLGRWWDSGRTMAYPGPMRLLHRHFPVQAHLFDELTARFHGPQRSHWYLSDGGHFENMGAYELIRRRVPMIVVVDAEEDPDYRYEGFSNLVRKARIDFDASITPLSRAEIRRLVHPDLQRIIGTMDELRGPGDRFSKCRAVLATIRYSDPADGAAPGSSIGTLLYLKPTIAADDPVDLREYHATNRPFPHQSTLDQFFDEAQWESYRKLGEVIGSAVFRRVGSEDDPRFVPARLQPMSMDDIEAWHARRRLAVKLSAGSPDTSSSPGCPVGFP